MHILWLGKQPSDGQAGDEVFDRHTIAALRAAGHVVSTVHPVRVARWRELLNLACGTPHYRARYATSSNRALVRYGTIACDLAICSWEPLDVLASCLPHPVILIAHNITSLALPAMFPASRLARLGAARARSWERATYRRSAYVAIATLTTRERDYVASLPDAPAVMLTIPGMPPTVPLDSDAVLAPELVIGGTYDWRPKRRDLLLFAEEYAQAQGRLVLRVEGQVSESLAALAPSTPLQDTDCRQAIRLGLITDRFSVGHKLKTLAYIARNQIVLSFADVTSDFTPIADHNFFIRKLDGMNDIARHASEIAAVRPDELRNRMLCFQRRCAEAFTWQAVAESLLHVVAEAPSPLPAR